MRRKNKPIHASASRLGPEKLVLNWVRTILSSTMRVVKFFRSSQIQRKIFAEKRIETKRSFLRKKLNRKLTRMEKIWGIQNLCVYV